MEAFESDKIVADMHIKKPSALLKVRTDNYIKRHYVAELHIYSVKLNLCVDCRSISALTLIY